MKFLILLACLLVACAKPKPPMVPQETETPSQAPITSYGHRLTETLPKVRTGPSVMFALDDDRVRRDIDTDFLIGAKRIMLAGHACPLGGEAYNLALSIRRAEAVKANLIKSGINPDYIAVAGYGEADPKPGDYSLSRRVEITFTLR